MPRTFYNDNDSYAAEWLRNLTAAGHLPPGTIDSRSILDLDPDDLRPFRQCHFFAGIGGWSLALALAGWPQDREVWTGSCPCQPLSSAGQRRGHADQRHLWPAFHDLIAERRPATIFGEQVASKDGREWLAGVRADLEHLGYAVGAADLPAAGVGAPHIRQRLFWVADAERGRWQHPRPHDREHATARRSERDTALDQRQLSEGCHPEDGVADAECDERRTDLAGRRPEGRIADLWSGSGLGNPGEPRLEERRGNGGLPPGAGGASERQAALRTDPWSSAVWLPCLDGKARRVEPGVFPLADGVPARVGRLRAYGNAIVPQAAATFISAFLDSNLKG